MPSQTGPSASIATKGEELLALKLLSVPFCEPLVTSFLVAVAGSQPLSPAEMQAVMNASEQEMLHNPQNNYFETSPHPQYHGMMAGRKG